MLGLALFYCHPELVSGSLSSVMLGLDQDIQVNNKLIGLTWMLQSSWSMTIKKEAGE